MAGERPAALAEELGVETSAGTFTRLIAAGTPLPTEFRDTFAAASASQSTIEVKIRAQGRRGESPRIIDRLELPLQRGRERARVELLIHVDASGFVRTALNAAAGGEAVHSRALDALAIEDRPVSAPPPLPFEDDELDARPVKPKTAFVVGSVAIVFVLVAIAVCDLGVAGMFLLSTQARLGNIQLSTADIAFLERVVVNLSIAQKVLFYSCAATFPAWTLMAFESLKSSGIRGLRYTSGWAVGGYFVPVLNLVRPYQVMREIWCGTSLLLHDPKSPEWRSLAASPAVGFWWAFFVTSFAAVFCANASFYIERTTELQLLRLIEFKVAATCVEIIAAVTAIYVVIRIVRIQASAAKSPPGPGSRSLERAGWVGPKAGLSRWAVAAGWITPLALFLIPAPLVLFCGMRGLFETRTEGRLGERRSEIAVAAGVLGSMVLLTVVILWYMGQVVG